MELAAYLRRIGFEGVARPDLATLKTIHRLHLLTIPYENLDVQLGRPVTIDPAAAFEKIVGRRRGGWCYEMNGLLGWALGEIGFDVTRVAGSVARAVIGDAQPGNHLVLRIELEGSWLADVGFGDGPIEPFRISPGAFSSHIFRFELDRTADGWWRLINHPRGGAPSFDFRPEAADEAILAERSHWLQTAPQSPFVQNAVVQRQRPDGLAILRGKTLKVLTHDATESRDLASADEYVQMLSEVFGLILPEAADLWPAICARHEALFG